MRALFRRIRAWFRWRSVVGLALTTILERLNAMTAKLDDEIALLQADVAGVQRLASDLATVKAELAAAQAAGQPPTDAQIAALDAIHQSLAAIAPVAAPAPPPAPAST